MWHSISAPGATDRTYHLTIRPTVPPMIRRPPGSTKSGESKPVAAPLAGPAGGRMAPAGTAHRAPTMSGRTSRMYRIRNSKAAPTSGNVRPLPPFPCRTVNVPSARLTSYRSSLTSSFRRMPVE